MKSLKKIGFLSLLICGLLSFSLVLTGCGKGKKGIKISKIAKKNGKGQGGVLAKGVSSVFDAVGATTLEKNPIEIMSELEQKVFQGWKDAPGTTKEKAGEVTSIKLMGITDAGSIKLEIETSDTTLTVDAPTKGGTGTVKDKKCEEAKGNRIQQRTGKGKKTVRTKKVKCNAYAVAARCLDNDCVDHLVVLSVSPAKKSAANPPYIYTFFVRSLKANEAIKEPIELQLPDSVRRAAMKSFNLSEDSTLQTEMFRFHYQALLFSSSLQSSELVLTGKDPAQSATTNYKDDSSATLKLVPKSADAKEDEKEPNSDQN